MKRRLCVSLLIAAAITLGGAGVVWAGYQGIIIVTESLGNSYTNLALIHSLNTTLLVDEGYISSTGLDTRITDSGYSVLPHMLTNDKVLWVGDVAASTETQFVLFTGQEAMESFPIIAGHGGYVTLVDDADLEPGNSYAFGVVGYVDVAAGTNKNIIRKDDAVRLYVSAAGTITFAVTGGNSLVASGLTSGVMTIMVYNDGFEMWMEIDEVEVDRDTGSAVPNTANIWYLFENNVMPYVYYYGQWVVT